MFRWHITGRKYREEKKVDFNDLKDDDIVYNLGNAEQKDQVDELAIILDMKGFEPTKSFQELKKLFPNERLTHIEMFVRSANLRTLKKYGLSLKVKEEPIDDSWIVGGHYKCCGYHLNHPGCYTGPVKYEMTPWILVPRIDEIFTTDNVRKLWNEEPIPGAYQFTSPLEQIKILKYALTERVERAVRENSGFDDLGIEFYMLQTYGKIEFPTPPPLSDDEEDIPSTPPPSSPILKTPKTTGKPSEENDTTIQIDYYDDIRKNANFDRLYNNSILFKNTVDELEKDKFNIVLYNKIRIDQPINSRPNTNKYSTLNYFKWEKNSCWLDAPLTCLFSISGSEWEEQIRNSVYFGGVTRALIDDIMYLQSPKETEKRIANSIKYFKEHFKISMNVGVYDDAKTTIENMINAFNLSDNIEMVLDNKNPNIFAFVSILYAENNQANPSHFVAYVRQPDKNWIRIDNHDEFVPVKFILDSEIQYYKNGYSGEFKSSFQDINDITVVETKTRMEQPYILFARKVTRKIDLTKNDVLNHWKNVRNYLGMIQPVYLSENRQKERLASQRGPKTIPAHNVELFDKADPTYILKDIDENKFAFPDKFQTKGGVEAEIVLESSKDLKTLKSIFNGNVVEIVNNQLIKYAIIPEYEARIENGKLVKSNTKTDFDTEIMLQTFEVRTDIMGGKVYNI